MNGFIPSFAFTALLPISIRWKEKRNENEDWIRIELRKICVSLLFNGMFTEGISPNQGVCLIGGDVPSRERERSNVSPLRREKRERERISSRSPG